jgi:hypothetical protein
MTSPFFINFFLSFRICLRKASAMAHGAEKFGEEVR